jgi:hypothetical protein
LVSSNGSLLPSAAESADPFNGYIEEFRISHVQHSDDWIESPAWGLLRGSQVSYSAAAAWSDRAPRRLRGPELAFRIEAGGREGMRR